MESPVTPGTTTLSTIPPRKKLLHHQHPFNQNPSKLPSFRFTANRVRDRIRLLTTTAADSSKLATSPSHNVAVNGRNNILSSYDNTSTISLVLVKNSGISISPPKIEGLERETCSSSILATSASRQVLSHSASKISPGTQTVSRASHGPDHRRSYTRKETTAAKSNPTAAWLDAQQQHHSSNPLPDSTQATRDPNSTDEQRDRSTTRPVIPPIRSFRSSTARLSAEMNGRIPSYRYDGEDDTEEDRDRTLRALEGSESRNYYNYNNNNKTNGGSRQDAQRQIADSDDLFLNLARDGFTPGGTNITSRPEKRRSRIVPPSQRLSLPPVSYRQADGHSDEQSLQTTPMSSHSSLFSPRERSTTTPAHHLNNNSSRYTGGISRSSPVTPRSTTFNRREFSPPDSTSSPSTRRRPSVTDTTRPVVESARRSSVVETSRRSSITEPPRKPSITETALSIPRNQYRQSNLSYSSPRAYNSSPLVPKAMEPKEEADIPRASTEETESTTSTTAQSKQSTIWDDVEDLKHRMKRMEVIGQMLPASAATIWNSANERPRTASTTVTTNSTSPKRGRGNSTVSPLNTALVAVPHSEAHPNLRTALAKSKSLLDRDVYYALEKAANDALTISAMMGTAGQLGPISSAQSAVGSAVGAGTSSVTDRQVRKKADNMCRSLTELCIALNERKADELSWTESKTQMRPASRDQESRELASIDTTSAMRKASDVGGQALSRLKNSPRTLGRLSDRRNSLIAPIPQPASPQLPPAEATTPTQVTSTSRRTSLLLRSRRAATEDPEDTEEQESRFRAPSRAVTEVGPIGRNRNSPREYTSNRPLPEPREYISSRHLPELRESPAQSTSTPSSLPLRRHLVSNSLTSSLPTSPATPNAVSRLESRRYLERAGNRPTPERDNGNSSETQQVDNDRTQRRISMGLSFEGRGIPKPSSIARRRTQVME